MDDVTKVIWEGEWSSISFRFVDCCYFANADDFRRVGSREGESVGSVSVELVGNTVCIAKAKTFSKISIHKFDSGRCALKDGVSRADTRCG